jgi:hypothetical protein
MTDRAQWLMDNVHDVAAYDGFPALELGDIRSLLAEVKRLQTMNEGLCGRLASASEVIGRNAERAGAIPVSERLPPADPDIEDVSQPILAWIPRDGSSGGDWMPCRHGYKAKDWFDEIGDIHGVATHWLPLPPPP